MSVVVCVLQNSVHVGYVIQHPDDFKEGFVIGDCQWTTFSSQPNH
jgi:hypothetical protein